MSHAATKWAFDQPELYPDMKPGEALVLVYLADCHNPLHGCFPSQDYLAKRANLTDRSVRENLGRLRSRGLVNWDETRKDGHRGFNRYYLGFEDGFTPVPGVNAAASADSEQPEESSGSQPEESSGSQPEVLDTTNRKIPTRATGSLTQHSYEQVRVEPVTTNQEREGAQAREDWGDHQAKEVTERDKRIRDEQERRADFERLKAIWPDVALESQTLAWEALSDLIAEERKEAIERVADFIAFHREKRGKRPLPYLAIYLREKRWVDLPKRRAPPPDQPKPKKYVEAFDRAWFWLYIEAIHKFGDKLLSRDSPESVFLRGRVSLARSSRIGWAVDPARLPEIEEGARSFVQVHVDSPDFAAWASWLRQRGAEVPRPDVAPYVWLPSKQPPDTLDTRAADAELRESESPETHGDDDDA